jgi:Rab GDP dissociation inhibitor
MMSFFEKRRAHKFFSFVAQWSDSDAKTHGGHNLHKMTMGELFGHYNLSESTMDFIGHSIALHRDDQYLTLPAADTVMKMQLYFQSILRYGKSPYIYPLYGLGELPQAFARLSAVYGGTYMLRKPFEGVVTDEQGQVVGVRSENGEIAKCKFVVADPSYFPERVKKSGSIARCICFLSNPPIKSIGSAQIIVPAKQVGRQSDIYISYVSSAHNVVPAGKYVAIVTALAETSDPIAELKPGIDLLGPILEKFPSVSDFFEPLEDGRADKVFISKSFDQTTHFETTCLDIMDMYKRITGKDLDLSVADLEALQNSAQQ